MDDNGSKIQEKLCFTCISEINFSIYIVSSNVIHFLYCYFKAIDLGFTSYNVKILTLQSDKVSNYDHGFGLRTFHQVHYSNVLVLENFC